MDEFPGLREIRNFNICLAGGALALGAAAAVGVDWQHTEATKSTQAAEAFELAGNSEAANDSQAQAHHHQKIETGLVWVMVLEMSAYTISTAIVAGTHPEKQPK